MRVCSVAPSSRNQTLLKQLHDETCHSPKCSNSRGEAVQAATRRVEHKSYALKQISVFGQVRLPIIQLDIIQHEHTLQTTEC